jgi:hypothetical protein
MTFSQSNLNAFPGKPGKNTLVRQGGHTWMWQLTSGEIELVTGT